MSVTNHDDTPIIVVSRYDVRMSMVYQMFPQIEEGEVSEREVIEHAHYLNDADLVRFIQEELFVVGDLHVNLLEGQPDQGKDMSPRGWLCLLCGSKFAFKNKIAKEHMEVGHSEFFLSFPEYKYDSMFMRIRTAMEEGVDYNDYALGLYEPVCPKSRAQH